MLGTALTDADFYSMFSDPDDSMTSSLYASNDQGDLLDDDLPYSSEESSSNWDMFASTPDGNLFSENSISSCSQSPYQQPSKLRARGDSCQVIGDNSVQVPQLPNLLNLGKEADAPNRQFVWGVNVNGEMVYADEPKYYCLGLDPLYSTPVCGSGNLFDRWFGHPPLYPQIDRCSLSKSSTYPQSKSKDFRHHRSKIEAMNTF